MENTTPEESVLRYETFINNILKEDLKRLETQLQQTTAEIEDLIQQKHSLKILTDKKANPTGFKTQLNIGCNFYMEAAVSDTSKLLMNIGLNHYLEFSLFEANNYLDARIQAFEKVNKQIRKKVVHVKAQIKLMLVGVGELYKKQLGNEKQET